MDFARTLKKTTWAVYIESYVMRLARATLVRHHTRIRSRGTDTINHLRGEENKENYMMISESIVFTSLNVYVYAFVRTLN